MAVALARPEATGSEPVGSYVTDGKRLLLLLGKGEIGVYLEDCGVGAVERRDLESWHEGLRVVGPG